MADQPEETKTRKQWEKHCGVILLTEPTSTAKITMQEFTDEIMADPAAFKMVNWDDRAEWLHANGHEVTRENMVNHELPTAETEDSEG